MMEKKKIKPSASSKRPTQQVPGYYFPIFNPFIIHAFAEKQKVALFTDAIFSTGNFV